MNFEKLFHFFPHYQFFYYSFRDKTGVTLVSLKFNINLNP